MKGNDLENKESLSFNNNELRARYKVSVVISAAMIMSILVYALVVEILDRSTGTFLEPLPLDSVITLRYVFLAAAFLLFMMTKFIRKAIVKRVDKNAKDKSASIDVIFRASIIASALADILSFFGLALFFITGDRVDFYVFGAISLIASILYFPRYNNWLEWAGANRKNFSL